MKKSRNSQIKHITALAGSGLLVISLAGCSQGSVSNAAGENATGHGLGNTANGTTRIPASGTGNNSSNSSNSSNGSNGSNRAANTANGTTTGNQPATVPISLSGQPGKIVYGSYQYTIPVPAKDKVGDLTNVTAIDVPGGILWMTPGGFPDAARTPLSSAALWFTSAKTKGGSLWTGATLLHQFSPQQQPFIVGVTDGYAVVRFGGGNGSGGATRSTSERANGDIPVVAYSVTDGHAVTIGSYAPGDQSSWGHGAFVWADPQHDIHIVQVSTGMQQTISWPSEPSALEVVAGGVQVSNKFVPAALVNHPQYPPLPSDFHWVYLGQSQYPVLRVPKNWTVIKQLPGGSSEGVIASNPANPNEKVTVWLNACTGCYEPTAISDQLVQSFDSPLLGVQKVETYVWLNDHAVAYTLPSSKTGPYPTYGLTMTFPVQSGDEEVKVNVPASDKQLATEILDGILSGQRG